MTIAITGINGFIGRHLAKKLQEKKYKIIGIGKDDTCKVSDVSYFKGDILNKKFLEKTLQDTDIIVHLAAITFHDELVNKKDEAEKINLFGTKNVLDIFSKSKTKKFLYPSTGKVYGKVIYLPIDENHPTNPQNVLGKLKLKVEKLISSYEIINKNLIIFRVFNVYGPRQSENFLIPTIFKQTSNNRMEVTLGDVKAKRDYIYIDDLINAFILGIEQEMTQKVSIYNICTQTSKSASEIVQLINKIKGVNIRIKVNPALIRKDESKEEYGTFAKAQKELGWEPKTSLEEGLRKLCKQ